ISGSMSMRILPEIGAALFRSPTSSSNSEANTEEGTSLSVSLSSSSSSSSSWSCKGCLSGFEAPAATSSDAPDASFRCCR
uniref:Uncharacterized protein n=1 Tax=Acanthochromis polyacanthus TaxID=80966 RepID=A0A3Q1EMG8_9TELE